MSIKARIDHLEALRRGSGNNDILGFYTVPYDLSPEEEAEFLRECYPGVNFEECETRYI